MKKSVLIVLSFVVMGLLLYITPSYSSTFTINNDISGFRIDFNFDSYSNSHGYNDGTTWNALAGQKDITLEGFEPIAYCVELGVGANDGEVNFIDPIDYNNGIYVAWLMDQYSTGLGYDGYSGDKDIADVALQIAIWYTLYNYNPPDYSFIDPLDFKNDSSTDSADETSAWTTAESYWTTMQSNHSNNGLIFSGNYNFYIAEVSSDSGDHQNHIVAKIVPEPSTMILFGIGLLGIAKVSRRRY